MSDPYEIHVTVSAEAGINLPLFKKVCAELGVKPLLIDAHDRQGDTVFMDAQTSSVYTSPDYETECHRISDRLTEAGFSVIRVKVETHPWHPLCPREDNPIAPQSHHYFEAHVHITLNDDTHDELRKMLMGGQARLSKNAFKAIKDREYVMIATLRERGVIYENFLKTTNGLVDDIRALGLEVQSPTIEYAIMDTNQSHDRDWLA